MVSMVMCSMGTFYVAERDDPMERLKTAVPKMSLLSLILLTPCISFAADATEGRYSSVDTIWVLIGAFLVFFMQPGFAMVETGLTRAKNAGNIVMKNFMDFALGTIFFWIVGFGLMFGEDIHGIIGLPDLFVQNFQVADEAGYTPMSYLIFQTVFCATSATIVSGAMAKRTKFSAYCIYSIAISLFILFPDIGPGAAAGFPRWDFMILPALLSFTWWAVSPPLPVPKCWDPVSENTTPTVLSTPFPVTV